MVKSIVLITLLGIVIGLTTGLLDSFFHFVGFEEYKIISIAIFTLFFIGIYWSTLFLRKRLLDGFMNYWRAFINTVYIGTISSLVISTIRYVYLKHVVNIDIEAIRNNTEKTMLDYYSLYKEELIENRLSFIEFSYDPFISSAFYFFYYLTFVIIFALIASVFLRRIDRNISL